MLCERVRKHSIHSTALALSPPAGPLFLLESNEGHKGSARALLLQAGAIAPAFLVPK